MHLRRLSVIAPRAGTEDLAPKISESASLPLFFGEFRIWPLKHLVS